LLLIIQLASIVLKLENKIVGTLSYKLKIVYINSLIKIPKLYGVCTDNAQLLDVQVPYPHIPCWHIRQNNTLNKAYQLTVKNYDQLCGHSILTSPGINKMDNEVLKR